ncbi:hypothetical protein NT6N_19700 [Oceaniferula spumae]|uniref:FHA domain-containing protein n=1 Tax=Oceaniferula spumae TaxID=2979115 RepID=A0AAT9FLT3_9BACT
MKHLNHSLRILFALPLLLCSLTGAHLLAADDNSGFKASKAEQGVVRVIVAQKSNRSIGYGSGSGFYIGNEVIITNHHVVVGADRSKKLVVARRVDATTIELLNATVTWKDKELDIAILKVPGITCDAQTLSEAPIEKGSRAYAIGYPKSADASRRSGTDNMGKIEVDFVNLVFTDQRGIIKNADRGLVQFLDPTVSSGEIRKVLTRKWQPEYKTELEVIDHDVNIGHGNSGGPLFDEGGRIIGINTQGLDAQTIKGLTLADNVKNSARITEVIKVLKSQNIKATITDKPYVKPTPEATTTTIFSEAEIDWKIWAILGVVGLAAVASLIVAMYKKPAAESYTQYIKRVSGVSRVNARPGSNAAPRLPTTSTPSSTPAPATHSTPTSQPPQPTTTTAGWALEGSNPEEGKSPNVHFQITPEQLRRYHGELTLGRKASSARLVIDNTSISKTHAVLSYQEPDLYIRDNGSSNGTKVNGSPISPGQKTKIDAGDQIQLGEVTVKVSRR